VLRNIVSEPFWPDVPAVAEVEEPVRRPADPTDRAAFAGLMGYAGTERGRHQLTFASVPAVIYQPSGVRKVRLVASVQ